MIRRSAELNTAAAEPETSHSPERQPLALAPVTINMQELGETADLKILCYVMRVRGGASYRDISRTYQISTRTAFNYVREVLAHYNKVATHTLEEAQQISLERLDVALMAIMPQVEDGNLAAIDRLLAIEKRRAEIVGFDAARRVEMSAKDTHSQVQGSVNIREKWTPAEAVEKTGEIIRRLQIAQRESMRLAQEAQAGGAKNAE